MDEQKAATFYILFAQFQLTLFSTSLDVYRNSVSNSSSNDLEWNATEGVSQIQALRGFKAARFDIGRVWTFILRGRWVRAFDDWLTNWNGMGAKHMIKCTKK